MPYLIKSSICGSEDSERSGTSEVLHHASGLQGGVEGGEVLVFGDQGGHALPGLIDDSRGLGGGAGDGVDIWSAEVVSLVRSGRSDRQVVVEASDWSGVVGENSLGRQEWVEGLQTGVSSSRIIILMGSHIITGAVKHKTLRYLNPRLTLCLNWSALQRERSPLDRDERPQRFPLDRARSVMDGVVDGVMRHRLDRLYGLHGLYGLYGLYQRLGVMSMRSGWLSMVGPVGGVLSMMGSMGGLFSMMLAMVGVIVVVVMIVTISRDQREHH